jgi:hypothetical protein
VVSTLLENALAFEIVISGGTLMKAVSAIRPPASLCWSTCLGLGALLGLAIMGQSAPAFAEPPESTEVNPYVSKVVASYNIRFNGIGIGDIKFWSNLTAKQYTLTAKASISVLLGMALDWKGATSSSGSVTAKGPQPTNYNLTWEASDKREQIELRFTNNTVQEVLVNPPKAPKLGRVPITEEHLRDVVDPLSAIVLLSRVSAKKSGAEACERRLPIFDGKMRYDLIFSHKATKQLNSEGGYKGPAYVCRVKFVPIAGHRPGRKEDAMTGSENIEVWLVPLPETHLVAPYYVSIPTAAGTASMTSERFDIETPARGRKHSVVF